MSGRNEGFREYCGAQDPSRTRSNASCIFGKGHASDHRDMDGNRWVGRRLTEVRRRVLQNVADGKNPYDGFEDSSYGGAIRSVQCWRRLEELVVPDQDGHGKLTDAGRKALETGEY